MRSSKIKYLLTATLIVMAILAFSNKTNAQNTLGWTEELTVKEVNDYHFIERKEEGGIVNLVYGESLHGYIIVHSYLFKNNRCYQMSSTYPNDALESYIGVFNKSLKNIGNMVWLEPLAQTKVEIIVDSEYNLFYVVMTKYKKPTANKKPVSNKK